MTCEDVAALELQSQSEVANGSFKLLDILHHFSSGMKALGTEMVYVGVDELRQACGGAGFLLSSSIADTWMEVAPFPTYEGVNVIMYQQSSRLIFKQAEKLKQGKEVIDFFSYLAKTDELISTPSGATSAQAFLEPDHIERALATRAAFFIRKVHQMMSESTAPSKTKQNDLFALEVNRMTKLHLVYIMYSRARAKIA